MVTGNQKPGAWITPGMLDKIENDDPLCLLSHGDAWYNWPQRWMALRELVEAKRPPPGRQIMNRNAEILIGFGEAVIRMDGEAIYDGEKRMETATGYGDCLTFGHAEAIARHTPESRVEVVINGPFWGATWEWQDEEGVVTGENGGFA